MPVEEIPLTQFGLWTVEDAAEYHGKTVRAVQKWITSGVVPAVVIGSGNRTVYLLRIKDARAYVPPPPGRKPD